LRDLYTDTSSAWSFTPPNSSQITNGSPTTPPLGVQAGSSRSIHWSNKPAHNSIFDLAPSLDLNEPSRIPASDLLRTFLASALLQYTSSAIAMPWEVGKLLLQVQWVPRDNIHSEPAFEVPDDEVSIFYFSHSLSLSLLNFLFAS
jgi:fusion and transport protein UGO1